MKSNIFTDIVSAAKFFADTRKARKATKETIVLPYYVPSPGFYNTVEGCCLSGCGRTIETAAKKSFAEFPAHIQRALEFSPQNGEFVERGKLWRAALYDALPPKQRSIAMVAILSLYRQHIKGLREAKAGVKQ